MLDLGSTISHYCVKGNLGKGSFGYVYKVYDTNDNNKIYALKVIDISEKEGQKEYLEKAIQYEISIMKKLNCENSVRLIESFQNEDLTYLILELCDDNLDKVYKDRLNKTKLPYNELEVYLIMTQLNNCFKKMREGEEKVIHRDLKLENILVRYDKTIPILGFCVKLSDFGLSKTMRDNDITQTKGVGTPLTQAPEILFGKDDYNYKVDLWSIGIIIYQLLYKKEIPFNTRSMYDFQKDIAKFKKLVLPKEKRDAISNECFDLLNQLLIKEPEKRIDFDTYFEHKFFSEEHKKILLNKYTEPKKEQKVKEEIEIKIVNLSDEQFEKNFLKMRLLKEYEGFKLYKGKNKINNNIVYIKEINKDIIDKNKAIFNDEIKLLSTLNGPNFAKCFGVYMTKTSYFIIYEYFNGNILDDFIIKRKGILYDSLKNSIIAQLEPSFLALKKRKIKLENISAKSLVFSYYQNENNFLIKIFDYYLNSIFFKNTNDSTCFKLEDFTKHENDKNIEKISENNNISENIKPVIKDEDLEKIIEIIKKKMDFVINYFQELLEDDKILEIEIISKNYKEIIILLNFCLLECQLILNFLNINADKHINDINKNAQEIHCLKIYLNEEYKYDYSNINFLDHSRIWYYNKENPLFDYYINIFRNLKNKMESILNKYIENNQNNFNVNTDTEKSNTESSINNNPELVKKIVDISIKEGNLEKLFSKLFENIITKYKIKGKSIISRDLDIVKYLLEYIIFIKLIIKKEEGNLEAFEKIFENLKDTVSFSTFIGNKIKYYKEKSIFNEEFFTKDEFKENLILERLIKFYIKIIRFNS